MSDRFGCRIKIGGEVPQKDLSELIDAIIDAGVFRTGDDSSAVLKDRDEVEQLIINTASAGKILSLEDYEARYGIPGDIPEVCDQLDIDFDLAADAYGGEPPDLKVFRGARRGEDGKPVRRSNKWFPCSQFGVPTVEVSQVFDAIGRDATRPADPTKVAQLRRRLMYPELTPFKIVNQRRSRRHA
jgi:hypothetical protein